MVHRSIGAALLLASSLPFLNPAIAQVPDVSTLSGSYNVRYLGVSTAPSDSPVAFSGTFAFDGEGGFTVTGQGMAVAGPLQLIASGQYTVYSSGLINLTNPFDPVAANHTMLHGGIGANGAIFASSTDSLFCDIFIAIPQAADASNATLNGVYYMASLEFPGGEFLSTRNTLFSAIADGNGSLGNVAVQGRAMNMQGVLTTQTSIGASYSVSSNGSGALMLPAPYGVAAADVLLCGNKILAVSQGGNLFIAGSSNGYDMVIGIKVPLATNGTFGLNGLCWRPRWVAYTR